MFLKNIFSLTKYSFLDMKDTTIAPICFCGKISTKKIFSVCKQKLYDYRTIGYQNYFEALVGLYAYFNSALFGIIFKMLFYYILVFFQLLCIKYH